MKLIVPVFGLSYILSRILLDFSIRAVLLILSIAGINWFTASSHANPALTGNVPRFERSGLWTACLRSPTEVANGVAFLLATGQEDRVADDARNMALMAPAFNSFYGAMWSVCQRGDAFNLFEDMWGNSFKASAALLVWLTLEVEEFLLPVG